MLNMFGLFTNKTLNLEQNREKNDWKYLAIICMIGTFSMVLFTRYMFTYVVFALGVKQYYLPKEESKRVRILLKLCSEKTQVSLMSRVTPAGNIPCGFMVGCWFFASLFEDAPMWILCDAKCFGDLMKHDESTVDVYGDVQYNNWERLAYMMTTEVRQTPDHMQKDVISKINKGSCWVHVLLGPHACRKSSIAYLLAKQLNAAVVLTSMHASCVFEFLNPHASARIVILTDEFDEMYSDDTMNKKIFNGCRDLIHRGRGNVTWILTSNKKKCELRDIIRDSCHEERVQIHDYHPVSHCIDVTDSDVI
jgi:hypothetical protein